VGLGGVFSLRAEVGDFAFRTDLPFSAPISDLVVAQDRFIIALDSSGEKLCFFDTWNWELLAGATALSTGATVSELALSPDGNKLYLAYQDGSLRFLELEDFFSLDFSQSFSQSQLSFGTTIDAFSGNPLKAISVIKDQDTQNRDCVFLAFEQSGVWSLNWMILEGETLISSGDTALLKNVSNLELAQNSRSLFIKYWDNLSYTYLEAYQCFSNSLGNKIQYYSLDQISGEEFQGLGIDENGTRLVLGNLTARQLWLYQIEETLSGIQGDYQDAFALSNPADQLWVKLISAETNLPVFYNQQGFLKAVSVDDNFQFQGPEVEVPDFSTSSPLILADSSSADGYLYFAPQDSSTVSVISANPGIYNLTLDPGTTVEQEQFKISFETDDTEKYYTISTCARFAISPGECEKTIAQGEITTSPTTITITSSRVGEGEFILGIFVRDAHSSPYHQARTATKISINLPPRAQDFSLKFGDEKIFIKFKSQPAQDIARYIIYYGTNSSAPLDQPELLDDTGGDGNPPSPLIINQPEPGKDYELKITGLTNGERYYVQILTEDTSGLNSLSERKSTIPQETITLTEMEGEAGGFDCLGSLLPGVKSNPAPAGLLLIPLVLLVVLKIIQRRKR